VSPLISLIEDQRMQLDALGVGVGMLSSSSPPERTAEVLHTLKVAGGCRACVRDMLCRPTCRAGSGCAGAPTMRLLYVTPERLKKSNHLIELLDRLDKVQNVTCCVA
jgi:superfamily II DNA helicase RecQ